MNRQLDTQLKAIFDEIVTVTPAPGPAPLGEPLQLAQPGPHRRPWLAVAAATVVIAGIGSLIALTFRGDNVEPALSSPDVTALPPLRNDPASTSQLPAQNDGAVSILEAGAAPWAMPVSANRDRIDGFPILDDLPDSASAGFSNRIGESWVGAIGTLQPDGVPRPLVGVSIFAKGQQSPFPDAVPGRINGVSELVVDEGVVILTWSVDDTPLVMTGPDLDTMYPLVEHIVPTSEGSDRGGYVIVGDLPVGLVELVAPYKLAPMTFPGIVSEFGEFSVSVNNGPFLALLAAAGMAGWEPIIINSLSGFISSGEQPLIAVALSGDEIMYVSSGTKTRDELIEFAGTIRIGDESEFRSLRDFVID